MKRVLAASNLVGCVASLLMGIWNQGPNVIDWFEIAANAHSYAGNVFKKEPKRPSPKPWQIRQNLGAK